MMFAKSFGFRQIAFAFAHVLLMTLIAEADDNWPKFRGENSTGAIESAANLPDRWWPTRKCGLDTASENGLLREVSPLSHRGHNARSRGIVPAIVAR